jgi:hypothetical protein
MSRVNEYRGQEQVSIKFWCGNRVGCEKSGEWLIFDAAEPFQWITFSIALRETLTTQ